MKENPWYMTPSKSLLRICYYLFCSYSTLEATESSETHGKEENKERKAFGNDMFGEKLKHVQLKIFSIIFWKFSKFIKITPRFISL